VARRSLGPVVGVGVLVALALTGRSLSHTEARAPAPAPPPVSSAGPATASRTPGIVASPAPRSAAVASSGRAGAKPAPATPSATRTPAASGPALVVARQLTVKGRAPMTGYARSLFGDGWVDTDRNGCDTRNDILARDLTAVVYRAGTHDCVVVSGTLADPYTRTTIHFVRGVRTSNAVQIDHVVALGDAWQKGAQRWPAQERVAFANDPLNLLAVSGPVNQQKGDGDAATWLPPDKGFRCAYVARQVAVKHKYALAVTAAEKDAMIRVLSTCPAQALPAGDTRPVRFAASTATATTAKPTTSGSVYYANCTAARAAGVAPLHRGDPGYRSGLDRDDDGVACE